MLETVSHALPGELSFCVWTHSQYLSCLHLCLHPSFLPAQSLQRACDDTLGPSQIFPQMVYSPTHASGLLDPRNMSELLHIPDDNFTPQIFQGLWLALFLASNSLITSGHCITTLNTCPSLFNRLNFFRAV